MIMPVCGMPMDFTATTRRGIGWLNTYRSSHLRQATLQSNGTRRFGICLTDASGVCASGRIRWKNHYDGLTGSMIYAVYRPARPIWHRSMPTSLFPVRLSVTQVQRPGVHMRLPRHPVRRSIPRICSSVDLAHFLKSNPLSVRPIGAFVSKLTMRGEIRLAHTCCCVCIRCFLVRFQDDPSADLLLN